MDKWLFLDFDGTLTAGPVCPIADYFLPNIFAVANVNKILTAHPQARIVITSWQVCCRLNPIPNCDTLRLISQLYGLRSGHQVFSLPSWGATVEGKSRAILDLMKKDYMQNHYLQWAALDDWPLQLPLRNFVRVDSSVGVSSLDAEHVIELLA